MKISDLQEKMAPVIQEIEKYLWVNENNKGFIYRYGLFSSGQEEGGIFALFDADSESSLEGEIRMLDRKFNSFTTTRSRRYYDQEQKCWYADYFIYYPFVKEADVDPYRGQTEGLLM
jgi:hypothetical protein